ncbi:hypothetical protein D3C77_619720 [compost metagenome]
MYSGVVALGVNGKLTGLVVVDPLYPPPEAVPTTLYICAGLFVESPTLIPDTLMTSGVESFNTPSTK